MRKKLYICSRNWELSSVGSEHRPYKAGVVGSSPTVPTKHKKTHWFSVGFSFYSN